MKTRTNAGRPDPHPREGRWRRQSLRKLELDERREIGIVIRDGRLVKRLANVFEADWTRAKKKKEK